MFGTKKLKIKTELIVSLGFITLILLSFYLRFSKTYPSNFYFTTDQGRDALYVREIIERHKILLRGPATGVAGIHAEPLWFYFLSLGYLIFKESPFGGVFMMILFQALVSVLIFFLLDREIGKLKALLIVSGLQFFWPYFETSLWAFNPFPLASLGLLITILLSKFLKGKSFYYFITIIPILLAFNSEVAGATALLIFYIIVGLWGLKTKIIKLKSFLIFSLIIPLVTTVILLKELISGLTRSGNLYSGPTSGLGTFSGTNFGLLTKEIINIISKAVVPQSKFLSLIIFIIVIWFFLVKIKKHAKFSRNFAILTLTLILLTFLFFGSNRGWRDWQTLYLAPVIFLSCFLIISEWKTKIAKIFLLSIIASQFLFFYQRFKLFPYPKDDPSILSNQLLTIDWIYQNAGHDGFNIYNYTNAFYDYPYQYLFWLVGKAKYKYLPCEYANYPLSPKELYVPGYLNYTEPKLGCTKNNFLIIESTTNGQSNANWIKEFRDKSSLLDSTYVGKIRIEKRLLNQ